MAGILDLFSALVPPSGGGLLGFPQASNGPDANNGMPMNIAPPQQPPQVQQHPFFNRNFFSELAASQGGPARQDRDRQAIYESLQAQGVPEPMARVGAISPQAFQEMWQQKMFRDTFNAVKQQFPNMSDAEIYTRISSQGGLEGLFTPKALGEARTASGAAGPVTVMGSRVTYPPGMGFGGAPNASQQPQPSQQPAGGILTSSLPDISPVDQAGINYHAANAGAVARSEAEAKAQPAYPGAYDMAQRTIARLEAFRDSPNLNLIVGSVAGRTRGMGGTQADLVNEANELQSKILTDTYTQLRNVSGRPVSPGALQALSAGTGDLIGNRVGTLGAYKQSINNTIDQIKGETRAAWEAQGGSRSGVPAPTWKTAASSPFKRQPPPAAISALKSQPQRRAEFDEYYGDGAAKAVLGQ